MRCERGRAVQGVLLALGCATGLAGASRADGDALARFEEILAGANGDSRVQFVELRVRREGDRDWGPQASDADFPEPRVILTAHDASGAQTGVFPFGSSLPTPAPASDPDERAILLASVAFEDATGLAADYRIPPLLASADGMVCLRGNPANGAAPALVVCLAYGNYRGPEVPDACGNPNGPPAPALPGAGAAPLSLSRFQNGGPLQQYGCTEAGPNNADFALSAPSPENSAGETAALAALPLLEQGRALFRLETFNGNGRTCQTCHVPEDSFGLSSESVAARFAVAPFDPLFVAELDPDLAQIENACLMRMGDERALVLENIDGFGNAPVFRNSPHLLNIARTAPYGLSGEFPDLPSFSTGAVEQHFPKTLARNADPAAGPLDFRLPAAFELQALEAFMSSIEFPADGNLDQNRMVAFALQNGGDEETIQRGRQLFDGLIGNTQCFRCHIGPALFQADGSLGTGVGAQAFATGVVERAENDDDGCAGGPGDPSPPLPPEDGGAREFDTPPLLGIARTGGFFHDNSAASLRDAVLFYASEEFAASDAGQRMPSPVDLTEAEADDIAAFLEAISVDPSAIPACADGIDNDGDGGVDAAGDPGCDGPGDESERDLSLPCDDGLDNDGDRLVDAGEDPGCAAAGDGSEAFRSDVAIAIDPSPPVQARPPLRVVLAGSPELDVNGFEAAALALGPGLAPPQHDLARHPEKLAHVEDVDGDGFDDLVTHHEFWRTGFKVGDSQGCLSGTFRAQPFVACAALDLQYDGCTNGLGLLWLPSLAALVALRRRA